MPNRLFDQVVSMTQLTPAFATQLVTRACARAGVVPDSLQTEQLPALLVHVEPAMALFMLPEVAHERIQILQRHVTDNKEAAVR